LRPEPGQAGEVVSVDDDVVKPDRHSHSMRRRPDCLPADSPSHLCRWAVACESAETRVPLRAEATVRPAFADLVGEVNQSGPATNNARAAAVADRGCGCSAGVNDGPNLSSFRRSDLRRGMAAIEPASWGGPRWLGVPQLEPRMMSFSSAKVWIR
jgi:hypothetical protein